MSGSGTETDLRARLPELLPRAVRWVERQASELGDRGEPLDDAGRAHARAVGVRAPQRIRVAELESLPLPDEPELAAVALSSGLLGPAAAGLTFGYTILIRRGCFSERLLRHELRHVHQVEVAGSIAAFLARYLEEIATVGYRAAPLEADARAHEAAD